MHVGAHHPEPPRGGRGGGRGGGEGGGTLGISGWGCAAGTLEPLAYTKASSAEFCYTILEFTPTDFRLNTDT